MISAFFSRLPVFSWSSCRARMAFLGPVISPLDRWCPSHHGIMAVADLTNLRTLNWCSCDIRPVIRLSFVWRREIHVAFVSVWGICCILELKYLICRLFASFRSTKKKTVFATCGFYQFSTGFQRCLDGFHGFLDGLQFMCLPHFGTSNSHLNGICYMLVLQTFTWVYLGLFYGFI